LDLAMKGFVGIQNITISIQMIMVALFHDNYHS
jgi:hypothetical protein